jgi:predicted RecA/RadA family phage recombinase
VPPPLFSSPSILKGKDMKNFIQRGGTITVPAPYDVSSGDGVLIGDIFGVAQFDAKSGDDVEIATTGVFELAKTSAQAWASVGTALYWDASDKVVTSTASTNKLIGVNLVAAANPSDTGTVRLNGVFSAPSAAQMTAGDA